MKKIVRNNRVLLLAFFTVFSLHAVPAPAGSSDKVLPVELKYKGHINNHPLYKLIVKGHAEPDEFTVIIRDSGKNVLFSENIKGGQFSKSFLLNTEEMGDDSLDFIVTSKRTKKSVTYRINRQSHLSEEMETIYPE